METRLQSKHHLFIVINFHSGGSTSSTAYTL